MPILAQSSYRAPLWLRNGHLQTIWPALFRKIPLPRLWRERLETPDGDFFDIDRIPAVPGTQACRVVILSHGLEGHSRRSYMLATARALNLAGWDVVARNFRGCSGEPNRKLRLYHSGETDDLALAVQYCEALGYTDIALAGFSMGGNQKLKYVGENRLPASVRAAAGISVPCDLEGAAEVLARPSRALYMTYFLRTLREKLYLKKQQFPDALDLTGLESIRTFNEFDERFTAPMHGFRSALHYWRESGCINVLDTIRIPTLLVNAADDPFLSAGCYPQNTAATNPALTLEVPRWGGHVGFVGTGSMADWMARRVVSFFGQVCGDTRLSPHSA